MGSRGIYHEGWMAGTFGPRTPWVGAFPDLSDWDPMQDRWELFDTRQDFALSRDLAAEQPEKLEELKSLFMREAEANKVLPIGSGLYMPLNPQEMKRSTNTEWTLFEGMTRIPESQAPNVRNGNLRAEIELEAPRNANGVIFAMGGYAGGVTLYAYKGELRYEYSALLLKRTKIKVGRLPAGKVTIAFEMRTPSERAVPAEVTFWINGEQAATGTVERTIPVGFTASETFDVGMDTSSPVAMTTSNRHPSRSTEPSNACTSRTSVTDRTGQSSRSSHMSSSPDENRQVSDVQGAAINEVRCSVCCRGTRAALVRAPGHRRRLPGRRRSRDRVRRQDPLGVPGVAFIKTVDAD
jgi:arylsulfatase